MQRKLRKLPARRRRQRAGFFATAILVALAFTTSCASAGKYIWYSELPRSDWTAAAGEYVIGVGDSIDIRVYQQEEVSGTFKVRSDGRISLPLAGEVVMAGKHPSTLAQELEARLKPYIVVPRVTVNVADSRPVQITTMGEVTTKGAVTIEKPARLVQALAQCGGLTEFGDEDRIFVIRQFPTFQRIRFTYDAIMNNIDNAGTFPLRTGDMIVVE